MSMLLQIAVEIFAELEHWSDGGWKFDAGLRTLGEKHCSDTAPLKFFIA
jgi:hypothetical protein